jgi:hypothetical protein
MLRYAAGLALCRSATPPDAAVSRLFGSAGCSSPAAGLGLLRRPAPSQAALAAAAPSRFFSDGSPSGSSSGKSTVCALTSNQFVCSPTKVLCITAQIKCWTGLLPYYPRFIVAMQGCTYEARLLTCDISSEPRMWLNSFLRQLCFATEMILKA